MRGSVDYDLSDHFVFTALRGIQAGREYYVAMCPLRLIPRVFLFNEQELPPQLRAQRALNKARIPDMVRYMTRSGNGYVFSSITASIDGPVEFVPAAEKGHHSKMGTLVVPMSARFVINDGQHRRAAIEQALKKNPALGTETISVVFYLDNGLKHSQQMFTDLNKHAVRPTTSINILYDHRDPFSRALIEAMQEVPILGNGFTELEKTSISNRANKVFTLNSLYSATRALLGKSEKRPSVSPEERALISEFWNQVYLNVPEWQEIVDGTTSPYDARQEYLHVYGITLHALGIMGHDLIQQYPKTWKAKLKDLGKIDWRRSNVKDWEGRALMGGRLTKVKTNVILSSNLLKMKLGLPLTANETALERTLQRKVNTRA